MKTEWTKDLGAPDAPKFRQSVVDSKIVLDKLKLICYNMLLESEKSTKTDYDSPSWAFKQADRNGYKRALEKVIELATITLEQV